MNKLTSASLAWTAIAVLSTLELLVLLYGAPVERGYGFTLHWTIREVASLIPVVAAFYPCSLETQSGVALFVAATAFTFPFKLGAIFYARPARLSDEKVAMGERIFRAFGVTTFFLLCGVVVWMVFGSNFFWGNFAKLGKVVECDPTLRFYVGWNSYLWFAIAAAWLPSTFLGALAQKFIHDKRTT